MSVRNLMATSVHSVGGIQPLPRTIEKKNQLGMFCFMLLLCTTLLDINQLVSRLTGQKQAGSVAILAACLGCYIAFRFKLRKSLAAAGWAYVLFMVFAYLAVGSLPLLADLGPQQIFVLGYLWRLNLSPVLILLAASLGARHIMLIYPQHRAFQIVFWIAMIGITAILLDQLTGGRLFALSAGQVRYQRIGRSGGFFTNPNDAGVACCQTAALGFGLLATRKNRVLVTAALCVAGLSCLVTFSRSNMITFFTVACAQGFVSPIVKQKVNFVLSILLLAGFTWLVLVGSQELLPLNHYQKERLASFTRFQSGEAEDADTGHRFVAAAESLRYWEESPAFGHGLGKATYVLTNPLLTLGPHNQYVAVLVEGGFILLFLYVITLMTLAWHAWRCRIPAIRTFVLSMGIVWCLDGFVEHNQFSNNGLAAMLGIAFGFLSAAKVLHQRSREQGQVSRPSPHAHSLPQLQTR